MIRLLDEAVRAQEFSDIRRFILRVARHQHDRLFGAVA